MAPGLQWTAPVSWSLVSDSQARGQLCQGDGANQERSSVAAAAGRGHRASVLSSVAAFRKLPAASLPAA